MKVVISRNKWSRGKLAQNALLVGKTTIKNARNYNRDNVAKSPLPKIGTMCCLGFACLSRGLSESQIVDRDMPNIASRGLKKEITGLTDEYWNDTVFSDEAAEINDAGDIDDDERERKLKGLCLDYPEAGIEFVFED